MRDPLGPIPSPDVASARAERFWRPTTLPPPPPPPRSPRDHAPPDPTASVLGGSDVLGIDRRHAPRDGDAPWGSPTTAAQHERVADRLLGLRSRHGWTLVRPLCVCPTGLLLQGVDLLDPHLGPAVADEARTAFAALAPALGATRLGGPRGCHSFLGLVCGCVLAPRLLEDLAEWGSGLGARSKPTPVPVTLLLPRRGPPPSDDRIEELGGMVAPMTDPQPDVLAIALDQPQLRRLRAYLVPGATRSPAEDAR